VVKENFNRFINKENVRAWMGLFWLWRGIEYRLL
jgi:hypothetical protein